MVKPNNNIDPEYKKEFAEVLLTIVGYAFFLAVLFVGGVFILLPGILAR